MSYREVQWLSATEIEAMGAKNKNLLNRYLQKLDKGDGSVNEDGDIEPSFIEVERVLDYREDEVTEVVDDLSAAKQALADAAGDDNDEEDGGGDEDVAAAAGAAKPTTVAVVKKEVKEERVSLGTAPSAQPLTSMDITANTANTALTGADGELVEVKPLSQSQINSQIFQPVERCRRVLEKLLEDPYAVSFTAPVDTELYNDYLDVVDEAMCLETVKERLEAGK
jgi:hypothetical protein